MQYTNRISFEIIPPKTSDKLLTLERNICRLLQKGFQHFSIVTQIPTVTLTFVEYLKNKFPELILTPHLSLINASPSTLEQALTLYQKLHIKSILVVRGDPFYSKNRQDVKPHEDITSVIQSVITAGFQCFASCYPEKHPKNPTENENILNAKKKALLGCHGLISQCIYNIDLYYNFCEHLKKSGCDIPILPSILPLLNNTQLQHFSDRNHLSVPTPLLSASEEEKEFFYAELIKKLLTFNQNHIPSLSYSTLNNFNTIDKIFQKIDVNLSIPTANDF